jgi:uncharacterized protein DUF6600
MRFRKLTLVALVTAACGGYEHTNVAYGQTYGPPGPEPAYQPGPDPNAYGDTQPGVRVSFTAFYDTLSPYGSWVDTPFGQVWRPHVDVVGDDFVPYLSNGQWVPTDYGWAFASDYDWGWAPFHYGNWYFDASLGWVWLPGNQWAPAWVDWRVSGDYVGWAPLPPRGVPVIIERRPDLWVFADTTHFVQPDVGRFVYRGRNAVRFYDQATAVRNPVRYGRTTFNYGPPLDRVQTRVGAPIQRVHVTPPPAGQVRVIRVPSQRVSRVPPSTGTSPTRVGPTGPSRENQPAPYQRVRGRDVAPGAQPPPPQAQPQPRPQPQVTPRGQTPPRQLRPNQAPPPPPATDKNRGQEQKRDREQNRDRDRDENGARVHDQSHD